MAFFGVTIEEIGTLSPIAGADSIDCATLKGITFSMVVKKGQYNVGDKVVYFPLDFLIPDEVLKTIGLFDEKQNKGRLSGKTGNRVKTMTLRGCLSQGVVAPLSILPDPTETNPEALTAILGVTKFEAQPVICQNATLLPLPSGLSAYDIEGCERFGDILNTLQDKEVVITEKLEGTNFSITWDATLQKLFVNQRNFTIEEKEGEKHTFWKVAEDMGLVREIESYGKHYNKTVTLYGELIGPSVSKNIYQLKQTDVRFFDLKVNGEFLSHNLFTHFVEHYVKLPQKIVPVLFVGKLSDFLNGKTVQEASNGTSVLFPVLREGIVIKPTIEENIYGFGRLILKQRSPQYLNKE